MKKMILSTIVSAVCLVGYARAADMQQQLCNAIFTDVQATVTTDGDQMQLSYSNPAAVSQAIAAGANVNEICAQEGVLPLTKALVVWNFFEKGSEHQRKLLEVIKILLQAGADVNKIDREGQSPMALVRDLKDGELTQLFMQYGGKFE